MIGLIHKNKCYNFKNIKLFLTVMCFSFCTNIWALSNTVQLATFHTVIYTLIITGIVICTAILIGYRAYSWLLYVPFTLLITACVASVDGTLVYFFGKHDFVMWMMPYLLVSSTTAFGFWIIFRLIEVNHPFNRLKTFLLFLSGLSLLFPVSSYFWLEKISLATMWKPVNLLFVLMLLGQVLPPYSWQSIDTRLHRYIRTAPMIIIPVAVVGYLAQITLVDIQQSQLNIINHLMVLLLVSFLLSVVIWRVYIVQQQKELAILQALEIEKNEAELQLALLQAEQNYQLAQASAVRLRSCLAEVSHDLKQPISALRVAIGNSQSPHKQTNKLIKVVDYIANLAHAYINESTHNGEHFESSDDSVERTELTVTTRTFADTLIDMFQQDALNNGIKLTCICPDMVVKAQPLATLRAMCNLISNAISHSKAKRILVGFRRLNNQVIFQVHDNGVGMTDQALRAVQEANIKGVSSSGHGLGLSIVKELCLKQGMNFYMKSEFNSGTSAFIEMKLIDSREYGDVA